MILINLIILSFKSHQGEDQYFCKSINQSYCCSNSLCNLKVVCPENNQVEYCACPKNKTNDNLKNNSYKSYDYRTNYDYKTNYNNIILKNKNHKTKYNNIRSKNRLNKLKKKKNYLSLFVNYIFGIPNMVIKYIYLSILYFKYLCIQIIPLFFGIKYIYLYIKKYKNINYKIKMYLISNQTFKKI